MRPIQSPGWLKITAAVILLLIFSFGGGQAAPRPQANSDITFTVEAGFDGRCKQGYWMPVRVTVENRGPNLEAQVEARLTQYSSSETVYAHPVTLPTISRKELQFYVYPEGYLNNFEVVLVGPDGPLNRIELSVQCAGTDDSLFGVIAARPSVFNVLTDLTPPNGSAVVAQIDLGDLPDRAQPLEALAMLVISDVDTGPLSAEQRQALADWVGQGGILVVAGGPSWQKTAAGLEELLPLRPEGSQTVSSLSQMASLAARTGELAALDESAVVATGSLAEEAQVLVIDPTSELALVIRRQVGTGSVVYLAADPAIPPLRNWDAVSGMYQSFLSSPGNRPGWANGIQSWYMASEAAATIPGMGLPSGFLICGFLALYVLVIGPINYLILKKRKRGELAWISVPVLVILFSGLSFMVGSFFQGNQPIVNRLAIVQVQPGRQTARVDGLVGIFSPQRDTYRLETGSDLLMHPIPGSGLASNWRIEQSGDTTTVPELRVEVGGMQTLALEGFVTAPAIVSDLWVSISDAGNMTVLEGTVNNNSQLTLEDAVLLGPGRAEPLGDFRPGEQRTVRMMMGTSQMGAAGSASSVPGSYIGPVYSTDSTIQDVLGTSGFYDNQEIFQRYNLLSAAMMKDYTSLGRGGGFYLTGWAQSTLLDAGIQENRYEQHDLTLYVFSLYPQLELPEEDLPEGRLVIPPSMFTWTLLTSNQYGEISPYNTYLNEGSYFTIQYSLSGNVPYSQVESLILHIQGSGGNTAESGLQISIWDYEAGSFYLQTGLSWGDHELPDPRRFIGPGGVIRVQVKSAEDDMFLGSIQIDRLDFTLIVEQ